MTRTMRKALCLFLSPFNPRRRHKAGPTVGQGEMVHPSNRLSVPLKAKTGLDAMNSLNQFLLAESV